MPIEKQKKVLSVDNLRHAEYYDMQETMDELYSKSKSGQTFDNLMGIILSKNNILLAYRNIKANDGSHTPGTDKLTIENIGRLTADEVVEKVRFIVCGGKHGYRPKPVRRKDIPKPNGKTRPLGIPCIWDRLVQQCIKQIMEPICEAKFSENSYGFRPNRSIEHAMKTMYRLMQIVGLSYVIEFDIKGFFDNVNHSKLIKQIWAMGIHDKHLIYVLRQILKAPISMPDGSVERPLKGTPQGGIISPLLANIVLNELDHWIESQWQFNPVAFKYKGGINKSGSEVLSHGYRAMKSTGLKEMYIVRYADDFRILCRKKTDAQKIMIAVTQWLSERLHLEVSPEKTRIVNTKRRYTEFLGFKIKMQPKRNKYLVKSHISDKQFEEKRKKLVEQAKKIVSPSKGKTEYDEVVLYNAMVMGIQNYYRIATCISLDCREIGRNVMTVFTNRLQEQRKSRLKKEGRKLSKVEMEWYGKSKAIRYIAGTEEPIYPISYVKFKQPIAKVRKRCCYTKEGREGLHDNLQINISIMLDVMRQPLINRTVEYADNRISLFCAQWGKCAVTGWEFRSVHDIHCHHILMRQNGGNDKYDNLVLVYEPIHKLIHAKNRETINKYMTILNLNTKQLKKLNELRTKIGLHEI